MELDRREEIGLSACMIAVSVPKAVIAEAEYGEVEVIVSSSAGDQYRKMENLPFKKASATTGKNYLRVNKDDKRQEFLGVGGAITERNLNIDFKPVIGKYVRMQGLERNNRYGYSIYEAQINIGK